MLLARIKPGATSILKKAHGVWNAEFETMGIAN
jgi:hypothetical protein